MEKRKITFYTHFEEKNGIKEWRYLHKLHRRNGPAIIREDGSYEYYILGHMHREDGPARRLKNGILEYFQFDFLHREDGPAVIYPTGEVEYWLNGKHFSEEDYYSRAYWVNTGLSTQEEFERIN